MCLHEIDTSCKLLTFAARASQVAWDGMPFCLTQDGMCILRLPFTQIGIQALQRQRFDNSYQKDVLALSILSGREPPILGATILLY